MPRHDGVFTHKRRRRDDSGERRGCFCGTTWEEGASKSEVARRLGVSRRTVHRWIASGQLDRELDEALALEAREFGAVSSTEDKAEGIAAFLEKRPAQFRGR